MIVRHLILFVLGWILAFPSLSRAEALLEPPAAPEVVHFIPGVSAEPLLECAKGNPCLIRLSRRDALTEPPFLPDPDRWQLEHAEFGRDGWTVLILKPRVCGVATRITLAARSGLYSFPVRAACDPEETIHPTGPATDLRISSVESEELSLPDEPRGGMPQVLDVRSRVRGFEGRAPVVLEDVDGRTHLVFPEPLEEMPVVGRWDRPHLLELPNVRYEGQALIVPERLKPGETWAVLFERGRRWKAHKMILLRRGGE